MDSERLKSDQMFSEEKTGHARHIPLALSSRLRVQDIMQENIPGTWSTEPVIATLKTMHKSGLVRLPVRVMYGTTDQEQTFIGSIRARDIFNEIVSSASPLERSYYDWNVLNYPVSKIMRHKIRVVSMDSGIERAVAALSVESLDSVLITDGAHGTGCIRSKDLLRLLHRLGNIFDIILGDETGEMTETLSLSLLDFMKMLQEGPFTAKQMMQKPTLFLEEQDDLMKAMSLFASGYSRNIPVLTDDGGFSGFISDRNILRFLAGLRVGNTEEDVLYEGKLSRSALRDKTIADLMQRENQFIPGDVYFWRACYTMLENNFTCQPVYDKENNTYGILTSSDLIKGLRDLIQIYPNILKLLTSDEAA